MSKRENYLDWNTTLMSMAFCISARSKDPGHQVGGVAVDPELKIISLGYNGMPMGLSDDEYTWDKENPHDNKYMYVVHMEENLIINSIKSIKGCTLYTTLSPCVRCCRLLIQAGIKKIIYYERYNVEEDYQIEAGKRMLQDAGIEVEEFTGDREVIENLRRSLRLC